MVPFPSPTRPPLARRLLPPTLLVLSALALMLAIAASTAPALAGVPPTAPRGNAVSVGASVTPTPTGCVRAWELIDVPPGGGAALLGIDDVAPDDIWSVGATANFKPRIEHYDGTGWTVVTPTVAITSGILYDVSAVSANDVWAVGNESGGPGAWHALIMHYTGTQWTKVPYPNPVEGDELHSVEAISANDVWAVGANELGAGLIVLRWDGVAWTRVPTPPSAPADRLFGVAAVDTITATQLWAVGHADPGVNLHPLIMHYDGTQWTTIPVAISGVLNNVAAVSPTDMWAVGTEYDSSSSPRTLVMHYDGTQWTQSPTSFVGELLGIHARSANDIWATGSRNYTQGSYGATRVLHWDGAAWSPVQSPLLTSGGGTFFDVRATTPDDLLAVGINRETGFAVQLIARYASTCPEPLACQAGWNVVDTIDVNPEWNALLGIDASAPNDVWAVGLAGGQGVAKHWNGSYWDATSIAATPEGTSLWGVSAIAPNNVWAVGYTHEGNGAHMPLDPRERRAVPLWNTGTATVHWDGTTWTRVPSPNPNPGLENILWGVDGVSPNDVWAVGVTHGQGLILHWNGSAWTQYPLPTGVTAGYLRDVEAVSTNDVWVAGSTSDSVPSRSVILHWDGKEWSQKPSPNPGIDPNGRNILESIDAISANDIWAVGVYQGSAGGGSLTLHWDGTAWTHVPAPSIGWLTGVSGSSNNDVWVVATPVTTTLSGLHWNGSQWATVDLPEPEGEPLWLFGVVAPSQNEVWAAGYSGPISDSSSLIERYIGTCQTVTPTHITTTTATPTSTRTGTPATTTPTPNVQLCNPDTIVISDRGTATPYPSNINVSGVNGTVTGVSVSLMDFQHWFYDDVDILLAGPQGQSVVLMSDAGGTCFATTTLRFQDGAPPVPDSQCPTGEGPFSPSNYGSEPDNFPSPAPQPPYGSDLSVFNGTDPNGTWSLYIVDDFGAFDGEIEGGWCLNITTSATAPSPTPTQPPATHTAIATSTPATPVATPTACANDWRIAAPLPVGVCCYAHAQSEIDLYVIGGIAMGGNTNRLYRYNALQDTWTRLADLPASVNNAAAAILNGKIYVAGGYDNLYSAALYIYDIATDTWSQGAPMPSGLTASAAGAYGNKLYVMGGFPNTTAFYIYDIATNSWSIGSPLPHPYSYGGYVQVGSVVYMVSGPVTQRIDLAGGSSSAGPPLPQPRQHLALASDGTKLFAIGGDLGNGNFTNRVDELLLAPWPGGSWAASPVFLPAARGYVNAGFYTTARSGGEIWTTGGSVSVGVYTTEHTYRPVGCLPVTSTPTSTASVTPSATPACRLEFADVPPTHTFHPFVRCLACQGIITGYPCGGIGEPCGPGNNPYFRPNAYVTRGQLAKIVSESAGFDEEVPPSQWTFTDVPYGSTFWEWVERLAGRDVMAGYPCVDPNEPCDTENRPYFRPGAGATRGQLTKIVSNAAGFDDTIPTTQYTFTDVPPTHTFWLFVERLLLNRPGVMGGYPCGGAGEPCDTENRPYFRPNNPLTRGQTSKIVANTFFPGCDPPRR